MPTIVKLLDGAAAGVTGLSFKNGTGQPPYTLYTRGGYTLGGGAAGTNGVNIEVSDNDVDWARGIGVVGGENYTEAATTIQELVDIPAKSVIAIQQHHQFIRAVNGAGLVGTSTVVLEHPR